MQNGSFLENETILHALDFTLSKGGFHRNANLKKTALALVRSMKSSSTVCGRHQQIMAMLKKGATLGQMIKATGSSRRTIFRYLNHIEDAGCDLALDNGKYQLQ